MADRVIAKTWVCLSDIHLPFEDKHAVATALEIIKDLRPHGIALLGDVLDFYEISHHNHGSVAKLEGYRIADTFKAGNRFLDELDKALGNRCTERHWVDGNHSDRLKRWIETASNAVFAGDESVDIGHRLKLKERGYSYHAGYPNAHVRVGKLVLTHGIWCGKYPAARHMERFQSSVLVGHTHTHQVYTASTWEGQRIAYCQGHLADVDSPAMAYAAKPNNWITGFSVIQVMPNGNFWVQPVNFVGGVTMYGQSLYPKRLRRAS